MIEVDELETGCADGSKLYGNVPANGTHADDGGATILQPFVGHKVALTYETIV